MLPSMKDLDLNLFTCISDYFQRSATFSLGDFRFADCPAGMSHRPHIANWGDEKSTSTLSAGFPFLVKFDDEITEDQTNALK